MTRVASDKSDAFRLGCYAAAKHAGATHAEAMGVIGALDDPSTEKTASFLGQLIGKGIGLAGKAGGKLLTGLGKRTANFTGGIGKGLAKAKGLRATGQQALEAGSAGYRLPRAAGAGGPEWMKHTANWMAKNPKLTGAGAAAGAGIAGSALLGGGKKPQVDPALVDEEGAGGVRGFDPRQLQAMMMYMQYLQRQQLSRGYVPG